MEWSATGKVGAGLIINNQTPDQKSRRHAARHDWPLPGPSVQPQLMKTRLFVLWFSRLFNQLCSFLDFHVPSTNFVHSMIFTSPQPALFVAWFSRPFSQLCSFCDFNVSSTNFVHLFYFVHSLIFTSAQPTLLILWLCSFFDFHVPSTNFVHSLIFTSPQPTLFILSFSRPLNQLCSFFHFHVPSRLNQLCSFFHFNVPSANFVHSLIFTSPQPTVFILWFSRPLNQLCSFFDFHVPSSNCVHSLIFTSPQPTVFILWFSRSSQPHGATSGWFIQKE